MLYNKARYSLHSLRVTAGTVTAAHGTRWNLVKLAQWSDSIYEYRIYHGIPGKGLFLLSFKWGYKKNGIAP